MLTAKEIEKILKYANMPKLKNILTPELIMEKNVIYRYYCSGNGLSYIGKCSDRPVIYRWQEHIGALRNNRHGITPTNPNTDYFQHAWNKYGEDLFTIEVIEVIPNCTKELLNEREKDWISYYKSFKNGFNETLGGDGWTSEAARELAKKTWSDPEVRAKRVESIKIAQNRPEVKAKISKSNKKTWSDPEVRAKQSKLTKKTWSDPEVRAKRVESLKIVQNRPEVKAKKSEAMKGENNPMKRPEVRAKRLETKKENDILRIEKENKVAQKSAKEAIAKIVDKTTGNQKIGNDLYVYIAEQFMKGLYPNRRACAEAFGVDSASISDMFNYKYCRKSCRNEIIRLCEQYNYPMKGLEVSQ